MKSIIQRTFILGSALVLLPLVAGAQTEVERRVPAAADGAVEISNIDGSVVVSGWDRDEVEVTGTLGRNVEELRVESHGNRVEIEVELPRHSRHQGGASAHLEVHVPRRARVEVETVSAEISAEDIEGSLEFESVSGSISVAGRPAAVSAETVSGLIEVEADTARTSAETVSGSITLIGARGDVEASAVTGNVTVKSAQDVERADLEVVAGQIVFSGSLAPDVDFSASSHAGTIELTLPESTSARVVAESFSGRIHNDFGPEARRVDRYTPGKELRFTLGSGDGRIELETFSGTITLRRR
ncbi:MAG: DUF4097 family beta strand repeat protein [bacterium]|nr:DUF4097 family beta strand repeat protein [bacterium]